MTDLPADLALVSSYSPAELKPLLPALGWETLPPTVPLRHTAAVHYLRVEEPGRSSDAADALRWRTEEIASWAQTHDRPVAWVRAGDATRRRSAVPPGGRMARSGRRCRTGSTRPPGSPPRMGDPGVGAGDGRGAGACSGGAAPLPELREPGHLVT